MFGGSAGKPINGHCTRGIHSEDRGQPPGYDFVIFRKSRPEVWGSRTAGATDQTFLPERTRHEKMNGSSVYLYLKFVGKNPTLKASDNTARGNAPG
jgi:hypothetical protein